MKIKVSGKPVKLRINGVLAQLSRIGDVTPPSPPTPPATYKWEEVNFPFVTTFYPYITYGNGVFVACSSDINQVAYSYNGRDWQTSELPISDGLNYITYSGGKFLATIRYSRNQILYSNNGIEWNTANLPDNAFWSCCCFGNGIYVAQGESSPGSQTTERGNPIVAYSNDAVSWSLSSSPPAPDEFIYASGLAFGNNRFVATESGGFSIAYSPNGKTWNVVTPPAHHYWEGLCFANNKFFSVTSENYLAFSDTGLTWEYSKIPTPIANPLNRYNGIAYGGNRLVVVSKNAMLSEDDGETWETTVLPFDDVLYKVAYGNGVFAAISKETGKCAILDISNIPIPESPSKIGTAKIGTAKIAKG